MIISIKPKVIELFPGSVTLTRADINTANFQKTQAGILVSYNLCSIKQREVPEMVLQDVITTNEAGEPVTTAQQVQVMTTVDYADYSESRTAVIDQAQWDNWPAGDADSDANYIVECVLKNTGLERA